MDPVVSTSVVVSQPALLGMTMLGVIFVSLVVLSYLKARFSADSARAESSQRETELLLWAYQQAALKEPQTGVPANTDRSAA